jgi:4-amino-4-deoxy-L-arabinose transferase-like glycosyltransferase
VRRSNQTLTTQSKLFALAAIVFFTWLGRSDVTTSHEARIAQTGRIMAAAGWPWAAEPVEAMAIAVRADVDGAYATPRFNVQPLKVNPWLVPVLNGQIRLQKPPLPNWCTAVIYRVLGISEFSTRLIPAFLATLATLLIADLARLTLGRSAAVPAGLVWIGTSPVLAQFRQSTADPYLAFFTLAAVWAWVRGTRTPGLLLVFYVSLALGMLVKGPFIFLHTAIAVGSYQWFFRPLPSASWRIHLAGVALMLAIALPWPIYLIRHVENAPELWRMEITRGGGSVWTVLRESWRYLPRLFELSVPWTPLWIVGVVLAWRRRRRRRVMFPVLWCAVTLLVFSLSAEKKTAYLLPMVPAQTLLTAIGLRIARRKFSPRLHWGPVVGVIVGMLLLTILIERGDNFRSAKSFARHVSPLLRRPASVLVWELPAEASFYLPLDVQFDPFATRHLTVIERDRVGGFDFDQSDVRLPGGRVASVEEIAVAGELSDAHWRLIRVTVDLLPIKRASL